MKNNVMQNNEKKKIQIMKINTIKIKKKKFIFGVWIKYMAIENNAF